MDRPDRFAADFLQVRQAPGNWYWLVDGLMNEGYRLHLVNTAAVKQYEGLKHSADQHDARWLAHLLRLGILPEKATSTPRKSAPCATW